MNNKWKITIKMKIVVLKCKKKNKNNNSETNKETWKKSIKNVKIKQIKRKINKKEK